MPEPGDILLVRSPQKTFRLGRRLMRTEHDHVSVVLGGGRALNIVHPRAVLTPLERMLVPGRSPALLRPAWPSEAARAAFVADLEQLQDAPYNTLRGISLVLRLFLKRTLGLSLPLAEPRADGPSYICSDTMLLRLERHLPGFAERIRELPLDYVQLRCASTDDFLAIARQRPDLLTVQPLQ